MKIRGWLVHENEIYVVVDRKFNKVTPGIAVTNIGELDANVPYINRELVTITKDQLSIFISDGLAGYRYDLGTQTFTKIADFPGGYSAAFLHGYILTESREASGNWLVYHCDRQESDTWNPLTFGSVESNPDKLLRVHALGDMAVMFGASSIEIWYFLAAGTGFQFARLGGGTINYGLAAVNSVCSFKGMLVGLFKSSSGDLMVGGILGYQMAPLSRTQGQTSTMEQEWLKYSTVADAIATSYSVGGHVLYQITFPTANKTWVLDGATGIWTRFSSGSEGGKFVGELAINFNDKTYMSDSETGLVYELDVNHYFDKNSEEIYSVLVSTRISDEGKYHSLDNIWFDFEVGTTETLDPVALNYEPKLQIELSSDGGNTWKPARIVSLGKQGEYRTRARMMRLGRFLDGVVKVTGANLHRVILNETGIEVS